MKTSIKLLFAGLLLGTFGLSACSGGGGNKDAESFCSCYAKMKSDVEDSQCDTDMEKLEDEFKKDNARYEEFKKAAMKQCPDAEEVINTMN